MKILIGTTVARNFTYALDKFLQNQRKIQNIAPNLELVITTDDINLVKKLSDCMDNYNLRGKVICYKTQMPSYASDRSWSIAQGRETVRRYALDNNFSYLLSVDADMVYDISLVQILLRKCDSYDIVQSGYKGRSINNIGFGLSCTLLKREILEKMVFRCLEFKNSHVIEDGNMFEYDLARIRAKVNKGVFLSINHYSSADEKTSICPQRLSLGKRIMTLSISRYLLVKVSIIFRYDFCSALQRIVYKVK